MALTDPHKIYSISTQDYCLEITIHSQKHFVTIFCCITSIIVSIVAFPFVASGFFADLNFGPILFLIITLGAIGLAIYFFGEMLIWQLTGTEVIQIYERKLTIIRKTVISKRKKEFTLENLRHVSVQDDEQDLGFSWSFMRLVSVSIYQSGRIGIETNGTEFRIGSGLKTNEAEDIVSNIHKYLKLN